jgi:hypothetical protein
VSVEKVAAWSAFCDKCDTQLDDGEFTIWTSRDDIETAAQALDWFHSDGYLVCERCNDARCEECDNAADPRQPTPALCEWCRDALEANQ